MRHSVFWKIILGLTIVLTLAETGVLIFLYQYTYDHTIKDSTEDIKFAASSSALALETYDPDDLNDFVGCEDYLNGVCSGLGITYLYVLKPDIETKDELYLARGWGGNASEEYINHRYSGYLAKGVLRDEQIRVMNGEECVVIHEKNEYDDTLICYTPVKKYWSKAKQTAVNEIKSMVCAEISIKSVLANFNQKYLNLAATIVGATIVILILTGIVLYFRVSKPLKRISGRMKNFVSQKGAFFEKLPVKGKDEIAEMSNSFNNMAEDIDRFITDLSELNRQKAELNIAKNIQRGLLEKPDFENENVTINASMVAARIVGGDLYDYCALDNGNIFVSIADVSDKGVTAALFMARAVTMLHQYAKLSYSPSKILYEYNNSLAKHNPNLMFITTFAAIYNPKTKVLTYSNAGHNVPYIISDTLIKLDDEIGSAAGVFEDEAYPEFEIKLNDGDMLFLYTDGVTDAQNRDGGFFGEETLERILLESKSSGAKGVVNAVNDEIKAFVSGAEQFDDVTMLALQINSESGNRLHLEAKTENLVKIEDKISALDLSEEMRVQLNIIAEEIFVNICSYSYPETTGEVDVIIENENGKVTMTFEDSGIPFNQGENVIDIEDYDSENAVGGLGRFITFSMADDYSYERKDNKNILKIIKNIQENV